MPFGGSYEDISRMNQRAYAELKAENERLRGALEEIVGHADEYNVVVTDIAKRALTTDKRHGG